MKKEHKIIITPKAIAISIGDKQRTILKGSGDYPLAQELIIKEKWEELETLITKELLAEALGLKVVKDTAFTSDGHKAHDTLQNKLVQGYQPEILAAFKSRCDKNVWPEAVNDLLAFLKEKALPITPKGTFLAWKSVDKCYMDHHSKTFDNHPGASPRMKREDCVKDRNNPCGKGFHAGTYGYASTFNSNQILLVVEICPSAVTSVPLHAGEQKLRCDNYKVLVEYFSKEGDPTNFVGNIAQRPEKKDPETFSASPQKTREAKEPSKKEILEYAMHLKSSKKGDGYVANMLNSKFKNGLSILKEIVTNLNNPSRINKDTRTILQRILQSQQK